MTLETAPMIAFVATTEPARAKKFYVETLGLRLVSQDGFALTFDAGGTMLRVATVKELKPAGYTVLGWLVPNIKEAVGGLRTKGVAFHRYGFFPQEVVRGWSRP